MSTFLGKCALAAIVLCGAAARAAQPDDAEILGLYIQVNSFDIESALLGRAKSASEPVRMLAEHVSSDHLGVRQAAQGLATSCKVSATLPAVRAQAAMEHDRKMIELMALRGAAFDDAYLQYEIAFHRAAIDAVKTVLLPAAKCPALQAHLRQVLPAFEQHLAHTELLAKTLAAK
jgi:putative membrane protein